MSFEAVAYGEGSPGRVFKLDEDSIAEALVRIRRPYRRNPFVDRHGGPSPSAPQEFRNQELLYDDSKSDD